MKKAKKLNSNQNKAINKLIGWLIFFLGISLLFLVATFFNKSPEVTPEKSENNSSYIETLNNLVNSSYFYTYEVTLFGNTYHYEGLKNSNFEMGYKEINGETSKYFIDNTGTYNIINNELVLTNSLYENLNANYLNLAYLNNLFPEISFTFKNNSYVGVLDKDAFEISIDDKVTISIVGPNYQYKLKFN